MPDAGYCLKVHAKDNAFLCDDTDMFALLVYIFSKEKVQASLKMGSPIQGHSYIDIKATARRHASITSILPLHGLTGCDSIAATYGVGKTKAIAEI